MKIRSLLILCLLSISTHTWSENKWLSYGNGMINLNNVGFINTGTTTHKEMYDDTFLGKMYKGLIPSDRCNNGYTWSYKEWVNSSKKDKNYLDSFSVEVSDRDKGIKLSSLEGYSDITSYDTFKNWYLFKNPKSPDVFSKITGQPVTKDQYEWWLTSEDIGTKQFGVTKETYNLIEETYNLNDHYLSNTVPMYHNSIKFDDFELWISGTSCDLNLVSSESDSVKLIQDTLSKIGKFINSNKSYMELF